MSLLTCLFIHTMAFHGVVLLLLLGVFHTGLSEVIQTQHTVMATLGKEALFTCQLTQSKDVLQVTWQKVLSDGKKDLATYNKKFGPRVNPPFQGKVEFQSTGLQNCSIIIRRVTKNDESCYRCLFNTYPDGAFTASTCLTVYEQYEPVLDITRSNSTEESLVSCSATGRPAPAVKLIVSERDLSSSQSNTVSVTNPNGTVTVTTTAVLSGFHGNNTQIGCVVQLFSGAVTKVFKTIPQNNKTSTDGLGKKPGADESGLSVSSVIGIIIAATVAVLLIVAVVFYIRWKQKNRSHMEDPEKKTIPTAPVRHTEETTDLLCTHKNGQMRQRSTPQKETQVTDPNQQSSVSRTLY